MLRYDRANGRFRNSMSSFKQWSLQPASKPPRSVGWLWLDLCSVQWEVLIKSNSLCSSQAPNPSFPGMKLSMKNNVHSSNKISDPHLTPDLESRGLSVLSAVRRHRRPHAVFFLPMSNWLTEKALKPTATHGTISVGGGELLTYTSSCFSNSFLTKQGNQKEKKQCSLHTITVYRPKKKIQYSKN